METRRNILKASLWGIAAATAPSTARGETDADECDFYAKKLSESLGRKHGGEWRVTFFETDDGVFICRHQR